MKQINIHKLSVRSSLMPLRKLGCLVVEQARFSSKNHKWSAGDASHLEVSVHEISTILWEKNREEPYYYNFYEKRTETSHIENLIKSHSLYNFFQGWWLRFQPFSQPPTTAICRTNNPKSFFMTIHTPSKGARVKSLLAPLHLGFVITWQYILQVEELESKLYLHHCTWVL